jgi:hypothetical protein
MRMEKWWVKLYDQSQSYESFGVLFCPLCPMRLPVLSLLPALGRKLVLERAERTQDSAQGPVRYAPGLGGVFADTTLMTW